MNNEPHPADGRDCCCNCKFQTRITCHPGNKKEPFKGGCRNWIGFGCAAFFVGHQIMDLDGIQKKGQLGATNFFEGEHGLCEMHVAREKPLVWVG